MRSLSVAPNTNPTAAGSVLPKKIFRSKDDTNFCNTIRDPNTYRLHVIALSLSRHSLHHFHAANRGSPRRPHGVATATLPLSRGFQSIGMLSMLIWCAYTERRLESRPWRATRLSSTRTRQLSVTIRIPLEHEITFRTRPRERLDVESFSHVSSSSFRTTRAGREMACASGPAEREEATPSPAWCPERAGSGPRPRAVGRETCDDVEHLKKTWQHRKKKLALLCCTWRAPSASLA